MLLSTIFTILWLVDLIHLVRHPMFANLLASHSYLGHIVHLHDGSFIDNGGTIRLALSTYQTGCHSLFQFLKKVPDGISHCNALGGHRRLVEGIKAEPPFHRQSHLATMMGAATAIPLLALLSTRLALCQQPLEVLTLPRNN